MLGKNNDAATAVKQYREQLKTAGIDTIAAEVNKQFAAFKEQ